MSRVMPSRDCWCLLYLFVLNDSELLSGDWLGYASGGQWSWQVHHKLALHSP